MIKIFRSEKTFYFLYLETRIKQTRSRDIENIETNLPRTELWVDDDDESDGRVPGYPEIQTFERRNQSKIRKE